MKKLSFLLLVCMILISCTNQEPQSKPLPFESQSSIQTNQNEHLSQEIAGIETVEYLDNECNYGYNLLNEDQKMVYDTLSNVAKQLYYSQGRESISVKYDRSISYKDECFARDVYVTTYEFMREPINSYVLTDYHEENYEEDYKDAIGLTYKKNKNCEALLNKKKEIFDKAVQILKSLVYDGTDFGKALAISEWICKNTTYDKQLNNQFRQWSEEGPIMFGKGNCEGYSRTAELLFRTAGLENIFVTGLAGEGHAWNMVCLNGKWYHIDTTWMDNGNYIDYSNFMMSDSILISTGHTEIYPFCSAFELSITCPASDSADMYPYATAEKAFNFIIKNPLKQDNSHHISFPSSEEKIKFTEKNGLLITDKNSDEFYVRISELSTNNVMVEFVKKISDKKELVGNGMQRITGDTGNCIINLTDNVDLNNCSYKITVDIPEKYIAEDNTVGCNAYVLFDKKSVIYKRGFEIGAAFIVDKNTKIDKSTAKNLNIGSEILYTDVSIGKTRYGYEYVMYINNDYTYTNVLIGISENCILHLDYRQENADIVDKSINTLRVINE